MRNDTLITAKALQQFKAASLGYGAVVPQICFVLHTAVKLMDRGFNRLEYWRQVSFALAYS